MPDLLTFTNPKWMRLAPIYVQPREMYAIIIYGFLD